MLSRYAYGMTYIVAALENGPMLLQDALRGLAEGEADYRPDPERFTIREVAAHLADWEAIFLERLRRMRAENNPTIEGIDEGDLAKEHDYRSTEPMDQARLFAERRGVTVTFLGSLEPHEWERTAIRPEIGVLTIEDQAVLLPLHDSYHLRQVSDWRWQWGGRSVA